METFKIKRNDTKPVLAATLQYSTGSAVDLSGGSVFFNMATNDTTYTAKFSGACVITGSEAGQVEYRWQASDTARSGLYLGEFEINWGGGSIMTLPSDHGLIVHIYEDYDS